MKNLLNNLNIIFIIKLNNMDIKCAGCLRKIQIGEMKRIGKKYYCELCSAYIINTLKNIKNNPTENN